MLFLPAVYSVLNERILLISSAACIMEHSPHWGRLLEFARVPLLAPPPPPPLFPILSYYFDNFLYIYGTCGNCVGEVFSPVG